MLEVKERCVDRNSTAGLPPALETVSGKSERPVMLVTKGQVGVQVTLRIWRDPSWKPEIQNRIISCLTQKKNTNVLKKIRKQKRDLRTGLRGFYSTLGELYSTLDELMLSVYHWQTVESITIGNWTYLQFYPVSCHLYEACFIVFLGFYYYVGFVDQPIILHWIWIEPTFTLSVGNFVKRIRNIENIFVK